jgi:uroporphyrinogen decarboxylase
MSTYTHRQRLEAALAGHVLDRPPIALWRHFPVDDQDPESLAEATLHWQAAYDWDLVKVTPASSFCLRDWGVEDTWEGSIEGIRRYTKRVVEDPKDWARLPVLDADSPYLAAQLNCLVLLRAQLPPETPILQTVFSPLAQAKNLAGNETLLAHLRFQPDYVWRGLETIMETTRRFVRAARAAGVDGIFYAVQHAQAHLLTRDEFQEFSRPFDLQVLEAARSMWLNMLHLHGENVYFDLVSSYPVQVINWHDRDTAPSLAEAQTRFKGLVCGGLRRETLSLGTPEDVYEEAGDAYEQTGGQRLLLGTGCVTEIIAPHGNLVTARKCYEP